jgi:MFS family permease
MKLTERGVGRKPLYLTGLMMIPTRCALIILLRNAGVKYLLLVQICDGLYGGFCGLVLPFILADITFGTGRFSVITGLTSTCLSVGNAMSTFIGQIIVEKYGHITSLTCSLVLSFLPIFIFTFFMPETINMRGTVPAVQTTQKQHGNTEYIEIA